jgi:hypothetical protein
MVELFVSSCELMGLSKDTKVCLYQLRHGGASDDLLSCRREALEVQRRGRWRTDASVRRYGKPAQVQRALLKLTKSRVDFGRRSWENLEKLFSGAVAPHLPPK